MEAKGIHAAPPDAWSNTSFTGQIAREEREAIKGMLKYLKDRSANATPDWDAEQALERELVPLKGQLTVATPIGASPAPAPA